MGQNPKWVKIPTGLPIAYKFHKSLAEGIKSIESVCNCNNGLQKVNFSGEANSVPIESLPAECVRLHALLAKYDAEDIYNADKTGLFFRIEPNQILSTGAVAGRKKDKSRVFILFCANATGSHKLRPLILLFIDDAGSHFNTIRLEENDDDKITNTGENNSDSILPTYDDDNDNDVDENDLESDLDDEDIKDYLDNLPNSDDIIEYFQMLDHEILTEENLTDKEIVNLVQFEKEGGNLNDEEEDEDDKIPLVSVKKAVSGLKMFINYFEQQDNSEFNINDLRIFRKHLRIARTQEFNSKRQSTLDMFYKYIYVTNTNNLSSCVKFTKF
ncbi:unnamed protein product [Rhizophagus irregularis]|nr:unnamed protein product [Rhizophagus irregularis]